MQKYAKIINEETKLCEVGLGTDKQYYKSIGMSYLSVEQAYDNNWHLKGHCPREPEPTYQELRIKEYPAIQEQFDMLYHDKKNGTDNWFNLIGDIKKRYPKEDSKEETKEETKEGTIKEENKEAILDETTTEDNNKEITTNNN